MTNQFLIVGQGLAGSLLAYQMYKRGINFKIVASENIPRASDVAAGLFNPLVFKRLNMSWQADECLPMMNETYKELELFFDTKFLHQKQILKLLNEQESELWKGKMSKGGLKEYIQDLSSDIDINGLKEFHSFGSVAQSGHLELSKMIKELQVFFKKEGLFIEDQFVYEDLQIDAHQIVWKDIIANQIVFCEGYLGKDNPFFRDTGLNATKGELLEIRCKDLSEAYILNKNLFVLPVGNSHFKIGATYDWKNINHETTNEAQSELLKRFEDIVSLPYEVVKHYAGVRPTVMDRRPVLGSHPNHHNVHIFNGLGAKGVMLAPYLASKMIRFLTDENFNLPAEMNVSRFYKAN